MSNSDKEYCGLPNLKEVVDNVIRHTLDFKDLYQTWDYMKCIDGLLEFWGRHLSWYYARYMEYDDDPVLYLEREDALNELEEEKREWKKYKDALLF